MNKIMTIGHSTHPIAQFLDLLAENGVTAIADVRSSPFSRHAPQFNRDALKLSLKHAGIAYVFLGNRLGARSDDPCHYDRGKVVYGRLAASAGFRQGIDRLLAGAETHRVALMCAERDPLTCHRTILVSRALVEQGITVDHILADGQVETHEEALVRLMHELGISEEDLFASPAELREKAYLEQEDRIAYVKPDAVAAE